MPDATIIAKLYRLNFQNIEKKNITLRSGERRRSVIFILF
jgi:hypothetical protein